MPKLITRKALTTQEKKPLATAHVRIGRSFDPFRRRGTPVLGVAEVTLGGKVWNIPVNPKTGLIPPTTSIIRFLDVEKGDREGRQRSPLVDLAIRAETIAQAKPADERGRLLQYLWWMFPNEMDLSGVDTPDANWAPPPEARARGASVAVIGTKAERDAVVKVILSNFTKKERLVMKGLVIEIKPSIRGNIAGFYQRARGAFDSDRIVVGKRFMEQSPDKEGPNKGETVLDNVLTHELIHFLRNHDETRKGTLGARPSQGAMIGRDKDIEEAFTSAEETARMKVAPTKVDTGYYPFVRNAPATVGRSPNGDDQTINLRKDSAARKRAVVHDKQILLGVKSNGGPGVDPGTMANLIEFERTLPRSEFSETIGNTVKSGTFKSRDDQKKIVGKMFKGRKGVRAHRGTVKEFPNLAISRANISGAAEALDTYWQYQTRFKGDPLRIATHVFAPSLNPDRKDIIRRIARGGFGGREGRVREWKDGKLVPARI